MKTLLCLVFASFALAAQAQADSFDIQGHRGARAVLPENGLDGFRYALDADATTLELDIAITKDRVPVISHDATLNPEKPGETVDAEEFARAVVAAICAHGLEQRASVLSFDWRTPQIVQREAPGIPTVYLTTQRYFNQAQGSPWTADFQLRDHGSVPRHDQGRR